MTNDIVLFANFKMNSLYLNCIRLRGLVLHIIWGAIIKKILDRIEEMRPYYTKEQYFWNREIHYIVKNNYYNETVNFLFNLDV